jgi:DNA-binding response OmpR family regulator
VGDLLLDLNETTAKFRGVAVELTPLEFRLLHYLALNLDRPVNKEELAEQLYSVNHARDANAVEALVSRLRRKLGEGAIVSKRGFGYTLSGKGADAA